MRLVSYLRPYLAGLIVAVVLLTLGGALMSAVVATLKPLVNRVLLQNHPGSVIPNAGDPEPTAPVSPDIVDRMRNLLPADAWSEWAERHAVLEVPLLIVAVFLVRGVLLYFGEYLTMRAGACVIRDIRADLFETVVGQSLRFFQTHPTGQILSRILTDVGRLQRVTTKVLADFLRVGAMVPFMIVVVLVHDWRLSIVASVTLPLLVYPMLRLGRRLRRASTRSQESMGEVAEVLNEAVSGVKVVQGFGMETFESGRIRAALSRMLRADLRAGRAAALAPAVMELVGAVAGAALFAFAGYGIRNGSLDPGDFTVVLGGLAFLLMSVRRLAALNVEFQQASAAADRVFTIMDREREIRDAPDAGDLPPFRNEIRFERVEFSYDAERVLDGVDLTLKRGEAVALVGASGSGKSTLANLIPRFFDPTAGSVRIDGRDLRSVTLRSLRNQIGMVTQETVLFNDTVRRNIAYGRDDVPIERVLEVARAAHAHEFVERLPDGYSTRVGEGGTRLSAGQRQRLTIARALLKDAPILILDEATSALDAESEALVQSALERLMEGRTSVIIAHRLTTVRRADRIVVLEGGRIVEQGRHDELLGRSGPFSRLHRLQFRDAAP